MANATANSTTASHATNTKFFRGVRADGLKRYQLLNHIGRGACAPPPLMFCCVSRFTCERVNVCRRR